MNPNEIRTLGDLFRARFQESGDRTAMLVKRGGAWAPIAWSEVAKKARAIAAGLAALGVNPGERVALISENRPEWAFADMGCMLAAAVDVPIYATNLAKQCEFVLKHSGAVVCFCSTPVQLQKALDSLPTCPDLHHVVVFDGAGLAPDKKGPKVLTLDELIQKGEERLKAEPGVLDGRVGAAKEEDLCSLIYTSGTTGDPKGVMLSHKNFLSNVKAAVGFIGCGPDDLFLSFLPLSHVFERMGGYYTPILAGSQIAYAESIDKVRDNLGEVRPTIMCSVPRLYEKMYAGVKEKALKSPPGKQKIFNWATAVGAEYSAAVREGRSPGLGLKIKRALADKLVFSKIRTLMGGRLRFFVSGGAPLAREIAVFFHSLGILILEGYGLTETSPVLTANKPDAFRLGTVGKVIPGVELSIAKDGEILARGPNIMKGYFGNEQATKEVLDADGWFHTGDIGEFDKDGFLRITDRKKDLMKTSGGKYIAPQSIENLFKTDRFIEMAIVVADNRNFASALIVPKFEPLEGWAKEKGIAFKDRAELVQNPDVVKEIGAHIEALNAGLAQYEKIKKFKLLDRELTQDSGELTPTLKVKRKIVNQKFKDAIESMYAEAVTAGT